jgi:hypothetical protein
MLSTRAPLRALRAARFGEIDTKVEATVSTVVYIYPFDSVVNSSTQLELA